MTPEEFDASFSEEALTVDFVDDAEQGGYEKRDAFLIELIKRRCQAELGADCDEHLYQNYDWWPNHTRYIFMSADYCTPSLVQKLHELLTDEFENYRIQVVVHEDLGKAGNDEIGALCIYRDSVVIENRVASRCNLPGA